MGTIDTGYIKIHRSVTDWGWYTDANTMRVFFHLLLRANWQDKEWMGIKVKRGSLVTSRRHLASELHLTEREVRTALEHLEMTNEVTKSSYARFTVITVVKYNEYQANDQQNVRQTTNKRPASDQLVTTTKEGNKGKKGKNIKPPHPGWEMIIPHNPQSILDHHPADGWVYEVIDGIEWAHKEKQKK